MSLPPWVEPPIASPGVPPAEVPPAPPLSPALLVGTPVPGMGAVPTESGPGGFVPGMLGGGMGDEPGGETVARGVGTAVELPGMDAVGGGALELMEAVSEGEPDVRAPSPASAFSFPQPAARTRQSPKPRTEVMKRSFEVHSLLVILFDTDVSYGILKAARGEPVSHWSCDGGALTRLSA